jgi:WD40 repeat protein
MTRPMAIGTFLLLSVAADAPAQEKRDRYGDPLPPGAIGRLGTVRFRNDDSMITAAISTDKKLFATASQRSFTVWNLATGRQMDVGSPPKLWLIESAPPQHLGPVAFSPDGKSLALGAIQYDVKQQPSPRPDYQIRVYDVATGNLRRTISGLPRHVDRISFTPNGRSFITILHDDFLNVHDVNTGAIDRTLAGLPERAMGFVFSPDGKHMAIAVGLYATPLKLQIHELSTGKCVQSFEEKVVAVGSMAFFPDGKSLAVVVRSEDADPEKGRYYSALKLVDIESGKLLRQSKRIDFPVRDVCVSPDGKRIAIGNGSGRDVRDEPCIIVFDTATLTETVRLHEPLIWQHVYGLQFPDNDRLLTWGNHHSITIWDVKSRKRILPKDGPEHGVGAIAFSPDSRALIQAAHQGEIAYRVWNFGKDEIREGSKFGNRYSRTTFSHDDSLLFSTTSDWKSALLVDSRRQEPVVTWKTTNKLYPRALSADGRLVAATNSTETSPIVIYDARTGEKKHQIALPNHSSSLVVVFSADNRLVYVGTSKGIEVHDLALRERVGSIGGDPPLKKKMADLVGVKRPQFPIDPDREREQRLEQWRQDQARGFHIRVEKLILSLDGKRLISLGSDLRIWDVALARQSRVISWESPYYTFSSQPMALAPNGRWLAISNPQGERSSIAILDMYSGQILHTFKGHLGSISALAFSRDGRLLASGSQDTTTLLWDLSVMSRPQRNAKPMTDEELTKQWARLLDKDAVTAFDAIARLIDDPDRTVPFVNRQLAAEKSFDDAVIDRLIANLDAPVFKVRDEASRELAKLGWAAEQAMRKVLEAKPSVEVEDRLKRLIENLPEEKFDPISVFASRVTELLERVASPASRDLLTELAKGPASARITREANASLKRLAEK